MRNKRTFNEPQKKPEEDLAVVFEKNIEFEADTNGTVTILLKQDHPIQRLLRRLGAGIPQYKRIKLDAKGSFVFLHIDGCLSVEKLGNLVEAQFGDEAQPIYPRLFMFLSYMEKQTRYIKRVS